LKTRVIEEAKMKELKILESNIEEEKEKTRVIEEF